MKDNVGGFGGDSSRITLSGHGTGAALVNLLMISPLAAGELLYSLFILTDLAPHGLDARYEFRPHNNGWGAAGPSDHFPAILLLLTSAGKSIWQ